MDSILLAEIIIGVILGVILCGATCKVWNEFDWEEEDRHIADIVQRVNAIQHGVGN